MTDLQDAILDEMDECEPYSSRELGEIVDAPRRTVHNNLKKLADDGVINRKECSPRHISWWIEG